MDRQKGRHSEKEKDGESEAEGVSGRVGKKVDDMETVID